MLAKKHLPETFFDEVEANSKRLAVTTSTDGRPADIILDEVRVSNTSRSSAWIKATNYALRDNILSYNILQDIKHIWDAGGNLTQRVDVLASETETFTYDFLDRLTGVSGAYSESYAYNEIGNITSKGGQSYAYDETAPVVQPHAVVGIGANDTYEYDANGNLSKKRIGGNVVRDITWDVENHPTTIVNSGNTSTFIYDGDGNRVKKTEGGNTILYVNKYYEKNLTTSEVTTYYYLGDRLIAKRTGSALNYVLQDHLTSTSVVTDDGGAQVGAIKYAPFGTTRAASGSLPDKQFTGQRRDETGLYYYGARYYDPGIGRFISADTIVQWSPQARVVSYPLTVNTIPLGVGSTRTPQGVYPQAILSVSINPQSLNRYSYALNSPLRYTDPSGYWLAPIAAAIIMFAVDVFVAAPITLVAISSWVAKSPNRLLLIRVAEVVDILAAAVNYYCFSEIAKGSNNSDSITPQLPTSTSGPVPTTAPAPAAPSNTMIQSSSSGFGATLSQLNNLGSSVGTSAYQQQVNQAYNNVAASLGSNQVVAWSSALGYHAVDAGSTNDSDY